MVPSPVPVLSVAIGGIARRQGAAGHAGAAREHDALRRGGDDRVVVGAGDRYRDRDDGRFVAGRKIVVDAHQIGQRQLFASGEEVESLVGDAVGPTRRAGVLVAGIGDHGNLDFGRRDVGELQSRQLPGDVLVLAVLIGEGTEIDLHRRLVAGIEVGEIDGAANGIVIAAIAGRSGEFSMGESRRHLARGAKDDDSRWPGDVSVGVRRPARILMR